MNDHYTRKEQQQQHGVADKRCFSRFIFFSSSERARVYDQSKEKEKEAQPKEDDSELESQSDNNNDTLFKDERDRETENKKRTRLNAPADDPGKKSSLGRTFARPREAYLFY